MARVITHDDVRRNLGLHALDSEEIETLNEVIIANAQAELESILHRTFGADSYTAEDHLLDYGEHEIHLYHAPVESVSGVTLYTYPADDPNAIAYTVASVDYVVRTWGIDLIGYIGTTVPMVCRVGYRAGVGISAPGWAAAKAVLTSRCSRDFRNLQRIAAQATSGYGSLRSLAVEGYSLTWETDADVNERGDPDARGGFTGSEMRAVSRYRRLVVR